MVSARLGPCTRKRLIQIGKNLAKARAGQGPASPPCLRGGVRGVRTEFLAE